MPMKSGRAKSVEYSYVLDYTKFLCAILVVVIHTRPFEEHWKILDFYTADVLARIAVPLFFGITGFLFFGSLTFSNGRIEKTKENYKKLGRYLGKIGLIYFGWSIVYFLIRLPMWYRTGWWGIVLLKDFAAIFFLSGSYYHLWYLLALLYAVPCLFVIMTVVSKEKLPCIAAGLWIAECLIYSYSWMGLDNIPVLMWLVSRFSICFDAVFRGIPLLAVGVFCLEKRAGEEKRFRRNMLVCMLLYVAEASALLFFSPNEGLYSYLLLTLPTTYYTMRCLMNAPIHGKAETGKIYRKSSLIIYCLHPLILYVCQMVGPYSKLRQWITVTLVTTALALLWVWLGACVSKSRK